MTEEDASEEMLWYVLKVQSNREKSIRDALMRRVQQDGLGELFGEIVIPTEQVVENKAGKKKVTEQKLFPGYLFVNMILNGDSWYVVRTTPGVGDFTGAAGRPAPLTPADVQRMLKKTADTVEEAPLRRVVDVSPGDTVKIKDGAFESFEGVVDSVDQVNGKMTVLIDIFGRPTPVDLECWQADRI